VKNKKGILLLEVMVSIVVITAGLLFVMRVYSTAREALERSRSFFRDSLLLEEKMFDFEEKGIIEEGTDSGSFQDAKKYSWQVNAQALAFQALELGDICSVKLTVDKQSLWTYLAKKK
jgi:hypothetical protein